MNPSTAESLIVVSAVVVGGTYAYLLYEGKETMGVGEFATAFGAIYFTLSLVAMLSPGLGGSFALLVMVSDLLTNLPALTSLIEAAEGGSVGGNPAQGQDSRPTGANHTRPSNLKNTGEKTS